MEMRIGIILALLIGGILLAAMLPTALNSLYDTNSNRFRFAAGDSLDSNSKPIAWDLNVTQDTASSAIWNLFPIFAVLGGLGVLASFVYKNYNT